MWKFKPALLSLVALVFVALSGEAALAACTPAAANGATVTCTGTTVNQGPGAANGYGNGGQNNVTLTVGSGASVTGTTFGVNLGTGTTVFNFGSISGSDYGISASFTNLTNYGTITNSFGGVAAVDAPQASNVTNYGSVIGSGHSFIFFEKSTLTNAGYIKGNILFDKQGSLTNSGTIIDNITFASNGGATADTVTVLPGARFGSDIDFGGGADKVNFGPGSWILKTTNLDMSLSSINAGGNPYVVTGNRIVVADVSGFGTQNRAIMDIVGWISSVQPAGPANDQASQAFASASDVGRFDDSFASFPATAMGYAPAEPVFKGGVATDRYGNSIWAKGFGGRRDQNTDGHFIGSVTNGYGAAFGVDRYVSSSLRLGGFIGGSNNKSTFDLNAGDLRTDTLFAGVYARMTSAATFVDLALLGGHLDNSSKRNIGGGLLLETAQADYGGWFYSPSATFGHRLALGDSLSLTPALKLRYVGVHFDGFAESGSTANLTVGARDVHAFEERAELTLTSVTAIGSSRVIYRVTGGALAQQRAGGGSVDLTLLGQNLVATTPDQKSVFGGYAGAGVDWQFGKAALFAAGEFSGASDSSTTVSGKGGVRVIW